MQHYIQPTSHLSGWQPQATSFSVLRLLYYGPSFETIIRILQSEAVVLKQCALFMKLPRECSYQARRINQSLLVALCTIASIRQNFLLGRGRGGGGAVQKEGWQQSLQGPHFSQYSSSKNVIYIWWLNWKLSWKTQDYIELNRELVNWEIDLKKSPNMPCAKSLQSCLTLCDSMNCSPPGSSVHGILQARILEWVEVPFSRGSSWPRDQTQVSYVSCIGSQILYHCTTWEPR